MVMVWAAVGTVVCLFSGTQLEARWRLRGMTPHPTAISKSEMAQLLGAAAAAAAAAIVVVLVVLVVVMVVLVVVMVVLVVVMVVVVAAAAV